MSANDGVQRSSGLDVVPRLRLCVIEAIRSAGKRRFNSTAPFSAPSLVLNSALIRPSISTANPVFGSSFERGAMPKSRILRCSAMATVRKVEPRAVFGGEGELEASDRSSGEPGSGFFRYVRGMIIEDQLDRGAPRISGIEKSEEVDELAAGWRSLTRVWTLPVSRSIPANRLSVPWRLYS
jgi:hypothetical protein